MKTHGTGTVRQNRWGYIKAIEDCPIELEIQHWKEGLK